MQRHRLPESTSRIRAASQSGSSLKSACAVVIMPGVQKAFRKHHALQCGFCTPGMITTAHALLSEEPDCDAARVREVLSGNLCRCTGYIPIVEAVLDARAAYQPKTGARDRGGDRA